MSQRKEVSEHYTVGDLEGRILAALKKAGKNAQSLSVDDLAPVDEFHIRGRKATEELATMSELRPDMEVLDVGCGVGGTSRHLASTYGCHVTGIDLTEEYCRVAERLSAHVGLGDRTEFRHGSALELPFSDGSFDVVWTEHVQMNIEDKKKFYSEMRRVMKPGGQLAFHDIFAGPERGMAYPVPWAGESSISHLIGVEDLRTLLVDLGYKTVKWEDKTEASADFFSGVLKTVKEKGPSPVGLHLLMDEAVIKFSNVLENLNKDRLRVIQAVMGTQ